VDRGGSGFGRQKERVRSLSWSSSEGFGREAFISAVSLFGPYGQVCSQEVAAETVTFVAKELQ